MKRFVFILVLAHAASALAQNALTLTLGTETSPVTVVGPDGCDGVQLLTWKTVDIGCEVPLTMWVTPSSCGEAAGAEDITLDSAQITTVNQTGTAQFRLSDFPTQTDGGFLCGSGNREVKFKVCGRYKYNANTFPSTCTLATAQQEITYDGKAPGAPSLSNAAPQDSALAVPVTVASDATELVPLIAEGTGEFREQKAQNATSNTIRIEGLTNGTTYRIAAYARDAVGNRSEISNEVEGTPIKTTGFVDALAAGSRQDNGCNTAAGPLLVGAVAMLLGISRRRRS